MKRIAMCLACAGNFLMGCTTHYVVVDKGPLPVRQRYVSIKEAAEELATKDVIVTTNDGTGREVTVLGLSSEALVCSSTTHGSSFGIPVSSLKTIEVSPTGKVVLWSGLTGLCSGAVFGACLGASPSDESYFRGVSAVAVGALVSGGVGLVVGLLGGVAALNTSDLFDFEYARHPPEVLRRSMPTDTTMAPNREPSPGF